MHMLIIRRVIIGSWGLISDVDHKALWRFPTRRGILLRSSNEPQALRDEGSALLTSSSTSLTTAWLANVSLNVVGHFHFILDKTTSQGVLKAIYG